MNGRIRLIKFFELSDRLCLPFLPFPFAIPAHWTGAFQALSLGQWGTATRAAKMKYVEFAMARTFAARLMCPALDANSGLRFPIAKNRSNRFFASRGL